MIPEEYHGEIEKPHRRENPKLACIINGGQDLIARTFKRQNRPCRKIPPERVFGIKKVQHFTAYKFAYLIKFPYL